VEEKSPGEVVTAADREAEGLITPLLKSLRPDAVVVGEEATAADPSLLQAVHNEATAWLVDPLDGTSNFVAGSRRFAVMVALMEAGITTHAWIWRPLQDEAWVAQRGAGTTCNGDRLPVQALSRRAGRPRGAVRLRFLDEEHRAHAEAGSRGLGEILPGTGCAGFEYPEIVTGWQDFVLFRRTLPWDHAPGTLILQEAGGIARRWDGSDYAPGDGKEGLIAAADETSWAAAEAVLLQQRHRASASY
jgi:fructose-1,6-bisphosphatase/inositol monophosphatase family enzyme